MRRVLYFCIVFISVVGCKDMSVQKEAGQVSVKQVYKWLEVPGELQLIDVRTPEEYREGHIEAAQNINYYAETFQDELAKLDKKRPIVVYCRSGRRAGKSADILKALGFSKVYNLEGGILSWQTAGYKTVE